MSLTPARHNFTIYQGATFYKRVYFRVNGELQNLEEYSASLVIKTEPLGTVLLTLESGVSEEHLKTEGGIILGGKEGFLDLRIPTVVTSTLTWEDSFYELFITDSFERTDILMRGGFKIIPF